MKNIEEINKESVKKILASKKIPKFFSGDTLKVGVRISEGKRERIQYFEVNKYTSYNVRNTQFVSA